LDSETFDVRESAAKELSALGEGIEPALRQALKGKRSAEVRRRIEQLLDGFRNVPTGDSIRVVRAVEVLERIGTAEARQVLEAFAKGAPAARLTREAQAALDRLSRRASADRGDPGKQ
jgi:hypothetical protein